MGASSALESGQRLLPPDTPPDLVSPGATTYSSRSSPATEAAWNSRHLASPPMSDYERGFKAAISGDKAGDTATSTSRPSMNSRSASRQQLPSLSSLFGPPSANPQPSPSASLRDGPFPTASPRDRPQVSSNPRGHSDSYFPPTLSPPISQPRTSYDVKFDPERPSLHSLRQSASGPASPGFRALNHPHSRSDSRSDTEGQARWGSSHHDSGKGEYTLDSRDPAFRNSREHFRLQFPGNREAGPGYLDQRPTTAGNRPPATPTSTSTSEGVPTKDGLGPKIWTGSHFLPRFVRAAEVPGEGLCYFYDDGSHCKTVIDGEVVNAHWGVTKAGKPRKRLAIACITCREKKIKCDPDFPRCVQCEKFGRVCKFKNAPRGGHNGSPSTPPAEFEESRKHGRPDEYRGPQSNASSPMSPRTALPHSAPTDGSHKRLKVDRDSYTANGENSPSLPRSRDPTGLKSRVTTPMAAPEMPRIPEDVLHRAWQTDPYVTDPQSINAVVSQFFMHIDSTMILQFLPEQGTKAWVAQSIHRKSPEDLMLLYSMLAIGVTLSGGPKHIAYEYAQVAHYAQKTTPVVCLQVAQCRILLAVYYLSAGRTRDAMEVISRASATVAGLQLNVEFEKTREAGLPSFPLGLNQAGYCESRRRTLWSMFMLERLNGLYPENVALINPESVYIRLPADRCYFEEQIESRAPFFDPCRVLARAADKPQEVAPYLIEMVHLWAECQSSIYKFVHRPASDDVESFRSRNLVDALEHWQSVLPSRLVFQRANLEAAAVVGQVGSFLMMHFLHNHAVIKLNRYKRAARQLSPEALKGHVQRCHAYATGIVKLTEHVDSLFASRPMSLSIPPPMVATVIAEAVDVLSAGQPLASLDTAIDNVREMRPLVEMMSKLWEEAREARHCIQKSWHLLNDIRHTHNVSRSPGANEGFRIVSKAGDKEEESAKWGTHWEISEPLQSSFIREMDILYTGA